MKAAYLAYDKNSLMALPSLSNYFKQVDFYLVEQNRPSHHVAIDQASILADFFNIPSEVRLHTDNHRKALKNIQKQLQLFKTELGGNFQKVALKIPDPPQMAQFEISQIDSIKDIAFNNKLGEVYLEKDKVGICNYSYLFVEDHQIVSEGFSRFGKNIFKHPPQNSHVWLTVEFNYELKKPRIDHLSSKRFILIKDRLNESVLDNWFFVYTDDNRISVQQWVPFNQFKNSDFQKFLISRIEKVLKEKLDILHITQFNQLYVNATPGFSSGSTVLRNTKLSSLMPAFNFWTRQNSRSAVTTKLDAKLNDLKRPQAITSLPRG